MGDSLMISISDRSPTSERAIAQRRAILWLDRLDMLDRRGKSKELRRRLWLPCLKSSGDFQPELLIAADDAIPHRERGFRVAGHQVELNPLPYQLRAKIECQPQLETTPSTVPREAAHPIRSGSVGFMVFQLLQVIAWT